MDQWLDKDALNSLRLGAPDYYTATLFASPEKHKSLQLLLALDLELARIPDLVSEPMLGEIRLQWWRDALGGSQDSTGNPFADDINVLIKEHELPMHRIHELIDARSFDLSEDLFEDTGELLIYVKKTTGALWSLSHNLLNSEMSPHDEQLIHQGATAYGVCSLLASLPINVPKGRLHLPASLISENGVDIDKTLAGIETPELKATAADLATVARKSLFSFNSLMKERSTNFSPAFLPVTLVKHSLKMLGREKHNLLRNYRPVNPMYRLWKYWAATAFGFS